jgi:hypothetical protein
MLAIPLVALLLGGVVWVKVAQLHLVTRTSQVVERYQGVQAQIDELDATLAQRDNDVMDRARRELHMIPAPGGATYLTVPRRPASP